MTLQQLKYFVTVVRVGSFNAAAKELFVSQPTLSQQIGALETELGIRLFERSHSAPLLTFFGERVLHLAESMLAHEEAIYRESEAYKQCQFIRIGSIHGALMLLLPQAIQSFRETHADVRVVVQEAGSQTVAQGVAAGEFEFGIVAESATLTIPGQFKRQCIVKSELVLCQPALNGASLHVSKTEHGAEDYPFITLNKGYLLYKITKAYLRQHPGRTVIYTSSTEAALDLVAAGKGISILPKYVVTNHHYIANQRVVTTPLEPDIPSRWNWILIWNYDRILNEIDQALIAAIIKATQVDVFMNVDQLG